MPFCVIHFAADLIIVTEFHSTLIHPHSGLVLHGRTKTPAPSEAGPHVRLCRFAAGLDEPTLIYGEALPCHPPYTHINPSYSIWQRRKKPWDATLPNLICATFTFLTWSQATRGGQYIWFLFIVFSGHSGDFGNAAKMVGKMSKSVMQLISIGFWNWF